mmetsp:Transcript_39372/g.101883  ORF Transcript_39372/g.101883 Transcript_39372/m.101883 type:complete len:286 (-) Transcript_39372:1328-2185(-)
MGKPLLGEGQLLASPNRFAPPDAAGRGPLCPSGHPRIGRPSLRRPPQMAAQQDHAASSLVALTMPAPVPSAWPCAPVGATLPPSVQCASARTAVGSTSPSTTIWHVEVRCSSAPSTPFWKASSRRSFLQAASVRTSVVRKTAYGWPAESRQRPLPMKLTVPCVLTFCSMTSAASMPCTARSSPVWQTSKMQSWRMRASATTAHSFCARACRASGHGTIISSAAFSSPAGSSATPTPARLSSGDADRCSKRLMDVGTGPRSRPTGRFHEGAISSKSSAASPLKSPQ